MFGIGSVVCPSCGAKARRGDKFCRECGAGLPTGEVKCGNCQRMVPADAKFCPHCGKAMAEARGPVISQNRWARKEGDFATRIEVTDLQGLLRKPLIVEAGLKALFFSGGRLAQELGPGTYDTGGLLQKIGSLGLAPPVTVVLVDAADTVLNFWVEGLQTSDPLRVDVNCHVVVQVAQPALFFRNMMKGAQQYSVAELESALQGEIRNALQEYMLMHSFEELTASLDMKMELQGRAERHLRTTFERNGLDFVQVRVFQFRHEGVDKIVEEQENLTVYQRRAQTWEAMWQAVASADMSRIRTEEEMRDFLAEVDKAKLIREDEIAGVARMVAERLEDHQLAREHLLKRLGLERDLERQRILLLGRQDLEASQVEHQIEVTRAQHLAALEAQERERSAALRARREAHEQEVVELDNLVRLKGELQQQKAEYLERLATIGPEALIAALPADRAQIVAELRKTEILKDFTEEQILAMAAKDSPEIAKAFQSRFQALAPDALQQLYERMLAEKDKAAEDLAAAQQEHARLMSEMFARGLEAMSQAARPSGTVSSPGTERVMVCPECHAELPVGSRFCTNCGHKLI